MLPELLALAALTTSLFAAPTQDPGCAPPPAADARAVLARMTEPQRVGQLFMVGTPATGPTGVTASTSAT